MRTFAGLSWQGKPNQLSPSHVDWSLIDDVAKATMKPATAAEYDLQRLTDGQLLPEGFGPGLDASAHCATDDLTLPQSTTVSLRQIIHRRRSAVEMDGRTSISRDAFYRVLYRLLADPARIPFNALPWSPRIHLVFFVHRVQDLKPGLYVLVRAPSQRQALEAAMKDEFVWQRPHRCPEKLEFFRLTTGDVRALARQLSCHQEIAADGCFSVGMIADLEDSLQSNGAWFYPRLFWESGAIGQALYLAAEAEGLRGTGIGCFFDDPVHTVLGLDPQDLRYQSLYHFTAGTPVEDTRLTTLPAYPEMSNAQHDTLPVVSET